MFEQVLINVNGSTVSVNDLEAEFVVDPHNSRVARFHPGFEDARFAGLSQMNSGTFE